MVQGISPVLIWVINVAYLVSTLLCSVPPLGNLYVTDNHMGFQEVCVPERQTPESDTITFRYLKSGDAAEDL